MKELWNWLVKNFSNLFTIIGIVLTVYFSIFYVPEYIKENENEKVKNINSDLIESIQEVVYNNYELDQKQIEALIKGKEIKFKIDYPYSPNELLIQTQETFMANKFIPLNERVSVVNRIDSIRLSLQTETAETNELLSENYFAVGKIELFTITISIFLGIISALLGSISFLTKLKRERKEYINKEIELEKDEIETRIVQGINFEKSIKNILTKNNLDFKKMDSPAGFGFDFLVRLNQTKRIAISVKYVNTSRSLNMSSINQLVRPFMRLEHPGILIVNIADSRLINYLNRFSKNQKGELHLIVSNDLEIIEADLMKHINNYRQNGA